MIAAVVFGFAVPDGLTPVAGAAPFDVLARQIPRMLVMQLNQGGDRGMRFLPFLGNVEGRRCFLRVRDPLDPAALALLHRQGDVRCLVDGAMTDTAVRVRVHSGDGERLLFEVELPFDPRAPLDLLRRLEFELMGVLEIGGAPAPVLPLRGEALAWLLVARDELLALEANLVLEGGDPLRSVRECLRCAPDSAAVHEVAIDLLARASRQKLPGTGDVLGLLADLVATPDERRRVGELLLAGGDIARAATLVARAAADRLHDGELLERACSLLYRNERFGEARDLLLAARGAGELGTAALAQLAAVHDRLGERRERELVCNELLMRDVDSAVVARVLAGFLLEQDRAGEALAVVARALQRDGDDGALRVEHARLLLRLGRSRDAALELRRGMRGKLSDTMRVEAQRLLQLSGVPDLVPELEAIEQGLRAGSLRDALRRALRLLRKAPDVAEAWLMAGIARQKMAQPRRSERALRRALALQPDLGEAHNRLGILLVGRGRAAEGVRHLERAIALSPRDPSPLLHMAQACAVLGRHDIGSRHLESAERLGANPATLAAVRREFYAKGA